LTPEQSKQIAAAEAELRKMAGLIESAGVTQDEELRVLLRERLDARIHAILTDDQKAAWKKLTGEAWAGFRKTGLTMRNQFSPGTLVN
jgi:hypothetical protein